MTASRTSSRAASRRAETSTLALESDVDAQGRALFERWRDDPALLAEELLDTATWPRQRELLEKAAHCAKVIERRAEGKRRLAVRSGHKIGKSTAAVILALWFLCTRARARVILTSASARQIKRILWKELRRLYKRARWPIGGDFAKDPETGLQLHDDREIVGFSTNEPEKMAGISGPAVLYICDEASGIEEEIFEAIEGNLAGGALVILFSNPTKTGGTFFRAFHEEASEWDGLQISSEEAAQVDPPIPGLATKEWVEEKIRVWGRDSPLFAVRVAGEFPKQAENAVISLHLLSLANARWKVLARGPLPTDLLRIGVDVARYGGDETVIVWRRGHFVSRPIVLAGKDEKEVADAVMKVIVEQRRIGETPVVNIDVTGLGAAVYALLDMRKGIEVNAVHAQDPPSDAGEDDADQQYHRVRDELWWRLRLFLEAGGALPDEPKLSAECVAATYRIDPSGKVRIASKDEMKKLLKGRSPDRADATCLAVFDPGLSANVEKIVAGDRGDGRREAPEEIDELAWRRAAGIDDESADPFDDDDDEDDDDD